MTDEPTLFDLPAARVARDEAITRGAEHSDNAWVEDARAVLRQVAAAHPSFICDALWEAGLRRPSNDNRALGSILQWGDRMGLIVKTSEYRPSAAVSSHCVPRVVWRSLICEAVA